jgi:O-methyltransferase
MLAQIMQHARQAWYRRCLHRIYDKYRAHTMIPADTYVANLMAALRMRAVAGGVVECGVWRGGMIAGLAEVLGPERQYHLFDSFEGLPDAQDVDGPAARAYQQDRTSPVYFDNCRAEMHFAEEAMQMAGARNVTLHKGWFAETLPNFTPAEPIALLRLDGDWFESTLTCLTHLYDHMAPGGLILIDDYYTWDGCCRAVHEFLVRRSLPIRISQPAPRLCALKVPRAPTADQPAN